MLQQAVDLTEEGRELDALLSGLDTGDWERPTPFKQWTVNDVVWHLHSGDVMAVLALTDPDRFQAVKNGGRGARDVEALSQRSSGAELQARWRDYFQQMCEDLGTSPPDRRVPWFGPDMGVRMFTTARQMETWAHGHDIYDLLKRKRVNTDRLRNIAHIGVSTYGWTFANRKRQPPGPPPHVELTAPSGDVWRWHAPDPDNCVKGDAATFCHVVTQGRNVADTDLTVVGGPATEWMAIAQCFAGPPEDPPRPGQRI